MIRGLPTVGHFNPIINARKLTQQLIVNYFCSIEGERLKFIRNGKLKAGRVVIFPSSFSGSPRNMMQDYHGAVSIVRKLGKLDIF